MTTEHWEQIRGLIHALDERLCAARLSASIRIVTVNGEPTVRVASSARGDALAQLNRIVAETIDAAGLPGRYLAPLEQRN